MTDTPETIWATANYDWFTFDCNPRPPATQYIRADIADARVNAAVEAERELMLDAYKGMLVLHRMLDKVGLVKGVDAAASIADRIIKAHPEFVGLTAMRAGVPE